jgi:hypothetical protein
VKTETMTPEERAKAVNDSCEHSPEETVYLAACRDCLAAAIRAAEDEALENAAKVFEENVATARRCAKLIGVKGDELGRIKEEHQLSLAACLRGLKHRQGAGAAHHPATPAIQHPARPLGVAMMGGTPAWQPENITRCFPPGSWPAPPCSLESVDGRRCQRAPGHEQPHRDSDGYEWWVASADLFTMRREFNPLAEERDADALFSAERDASGVPAHPLPTLAQSPAPKVNR